MPWPMWMKPEKFLTTDTSVLEKWVAKCERFCESYEANVYREAIRLRKTKRKYLRVQLFDGSVPGSSYISALDDASMETVANYLKDLDPGDSFLVTAVEMTPEEVDALGDFSGF